MEKKYCKFLHLKLSEKLIYTHKLTNPYNFHKFIWRLWNDKNKTPFLFRLDKDDLYFMINEDIENQDIEWLKDTKSTDNKKVDFKEGYILKYNIRVNPVKKDKNTGKIVYLSNNDDIISWWERTGERCGFSFEENSIRIVKKEKTYFYKKDNKITIFCVDIEGILQVNKPDLFNKSFIEGFGRSKRFGCGLMLLHK